MVTMIFFFLSLLFTALALGPAFSHVLEMPGKRRLSPMVWLAVQQTLFTSFGRALGIIESAAFLATLVLAFLQGAHPGHRRVGCVCRFLPGCHAPHLGPAHQPHQ
jgi:hypothetical protein